MPSFLFDRRITPLTSTLVELRVTTINADEDQWFQGKVCKAQQKPSAFPEAPLSGALVFWSGTFVDYLPFRPGAPTNNIV